MILEISALESVARLAQRLIECQHLLRRFVRGFGQRTRHVVRADLVCVRGLRQSAHHAFQLRNVARPVEIAQHIQCSGGKLPRRDFFRLNHAVEYQTSNFRDVLAVLAQAGHGNRHRRQQFVELRVKCALGGHVGERARGAAHHARVVAGYLGEQHQHAPLFRARQARHIVYKQRAVTRLIQKLNRLLGQLRGSFRHHPWRIARVQHARTDLNAAPRFTHQHHRCAHRSNALQALFEIGYQRRAAQRGK